jgi:hypothetical protein
MVEKNPQWKQWTALGGIVAQQLEMLSDEQIERICRIQGFLIAAQNAGIAISREEEAQIIQATPDKLKEIAAAKVIDWAKIDEETAKIGLNSQVPQGVPNFMKIADVANILPKNKSGVVLAAQAAARMAETVQQMETGNITVKPLDEVLKPRPWIDKGKDDGEPAYSTAAQATQQLAEIFTAGLAQAAVQKPMIVDDPDVRRAMMAFQLYASQTLKRAGNELEDMGLAKAGRDVKASRDSLHGIVNLGVMGVFSEYANTRSLLGDIDKGIKKLGMSLTPEQQKLISDRLTQARDMEHKGIPLPSMLRMQHSVNLGSWAQRVAGVSPSESLGRS